MNEDNMFNNNGNDMMMNGYDSFGGEIGGETYRAKRPTIQILGPDGKPMAPMSAQDLEDTMIISQPILEQQTVAQTAPQPPVSTSPTEQVQNQPVYTESQTVEPNVQSLIETPVQETQYNPGDIQINEPVAQVQNQPVYTESQTVEPNVQSLIETPVQETQYNPGDIQINEPVAQVQNQPVYAETQTVEPNVQPMIETPVQETQYNPGDIQINEPVAQVQNQPVYTESQSSMPSKTPDENIAVSQTQAEIPSQVSEAPQPAVNPALRGFAWAQPPIDNGNQ